MRSSLSKALLPLAAFAAACSYSHQDFHADWSKALCDKYDECGVLESYAWTMETCLSEASMGDTAGTECLDYDSSAAKDCVDEWTAVTCDQLSAGEGVSSCDKVCSTDG
jgi:hypothetical protein